MNCCRFVLSASNTISGFTTPAQTPSLMETWNWGVKLKAALLLGAWGSKFQHFCLELKAPPAGGGRSLALGLNECVLQGQHSSWMKADPRKERVYGKGRERANGRGEPKKCECSTSASVRTLGFPPVFPEHPCLLSAPNTSLGMAGAGPSTWKSTINKIFSRCGSPKRILDSRPETVAPTQQMQ